MKSRTLFLAGVMALSIGATAQEPQGKKPDAKPAAEAPKEPVLPLKLTRKIEFKVSEVTWPTLDVSPDGKTVVFELLGDIYAMPITGGEAKQLVSGNSYDGMPRYSPDGKKIAFISDRSGADNVWTCDADGQNLKAVTTGRDTAMLQPAWTPDGNYIIYTKGIGYLPSYQLNMIDVRGGSGFAFGPAGLQPGTPTNNGSRTAPNRMGVSTSPDGRYIFYSERQGPWSYNALGPQNQIFRFDRQTGRSGVITTEANGAMRPQATKDGKSLLYFARHGLQTGLKKMNLETGDNDWVAFPVDRDDMESRATRDMMPGYGLTPDGKYAVMGLGGKIQKVDLETGKPTPIEFTATISQTLPDSLHYAHRVDETDTFKARIIREVTLSPDKSKVVFIAAGRVWTMDLKEGVPRRLNNDNVSEFSPNWSPDGKRVAYVTWTPDGGDVIASNLDGSMKQVFTPHKGFYGNPVYSPDSKTVFFIAGTKEQGFDTAIHIPENAPGDLDPNTELGGTFKFIPLTFKSVSTGGGEVTDLGPAPQGDYFFGKTNDRIYVSAGNSLNSQRLDGTDVKTLFTVQGDARGGTRIQMSADGDHALVQTGVGKIYQVTIPKTGETVNISLTGGGNVPVKQMVVTGAEGLGWSADGNTMYWSMGHKLYTQNIGDEKPHEYEVNVEIKRAKPHGTLLLRGAKIATMKGDQILGSGDILVVDNRIQNIGPVGSFKIPDDTKVMHMEGKVITPGYVDVHSHWFGGGSTGLPQSWGYLANLAYGVTTNRDPQSGSSTIYDFSDQINAGNAIGPRQYTTGPGVFAGSTGDDKESALNYLKRYAEAYDTYYIKEYVAGDRMTVENIALACQQLKLTPTTEGALEMKRMIMEIEAGISGHEHAIPIMPIYDDVAQFLAKTGTYYTPTLIVSYGGPFGEDYFFEYENPLNDPKVRMFVPNELLANLVRRRNFFARPEEYVFDKIAAGCAKVVNAGGKVCLGSHGEFQGKGAHWEMWMLASGGMTPLQVLKCATINGAEAIGLDQDLGSLEAGKMADLIIYDKDPLKDIRNTGSMHWVMKNGELFESDSMDQVYPIKKKLPKQYWNVPNPSITVPKQ